MKSPGETVAAILAMPKFGNGIGFRRLAFLLQPLMDSDWGRRFTTIKITGSNGKGSVAALVHSIVHALGENAGRHTSPHLRKFNERIVIGDREITDAEIDAAYSWLQSRIGELQPALGDDHFGSFELITALCMRCFYEAGVSVGVMEAGIGGRYDPTRLLPGSLTALTSVDLEHKDLLGPTKELIAYDKLDLCPDGGTVVGICRDLDLWSRLEAYAKVRRLRLVDARALWKVECKWDKVATPLEGMPVRLARDTTQIAATAPLVGTFQLDNIAIACSLVELWLRDHRPEVGWDRLVNAVRLGLEGVHWPGRFQQISTAPAVFIDVGHSPDAGARLAESVATFLPGHKILLVVGVSADKAVEEILATLVPMAEAVICTRAYHKGERVDRIASMVRDHPAARQVWEAATIEAAVALAREMATARGMTVIVAGGLFLAVEFWTAWTGGDPGALQFY
jgi:dihydrofolate synthase/folylpolyglutamate synthase